MRSHLLLHISYRCFFIIFPHYHLLQQWDKQNSDRMCYNHHDSNNVVKKLVPMAHVGVPVEVHAPIPVCDMWCYFVISCHPSVYIFDNKQNNNRIPGCNQCLVKCNHDVKNLVNLGLAACNCYPYHMKCDKEKMGCDVTGPQIPVSRGFWSRLYQP